MWWRRCRPTPPHPKSSTGIFFIFSTPPPYFHALHSHLRLFLYYYFLFCIDTLKLIAHLQFTSKVFNLQRYQWAGGARDVSWCWPGDGVKVARDQGCCWAAHEQGWDQSGDKVMIKTRIGSLGNEVSVCVGVKL